MTKDKVIGWIGTGLMGKPMVKHLLQAGYNVNIQNRTKSKAAELIELGCTWYDTPAEVAINSDIVVTIIGSPLDVEECYFGQEGLFTGIKPGTILIDMTTTKPSLAIKIAEIARTHGAQFIDAPVSGGEVGAINGTLSIMIGGDKSVSDAVLPLFETFGKNIVFQGPSGSGQHTKMCNQITIAGTLIGVCEGLIYGLKAGLNLTTMLESISKGAAGCWSLDVLAPKIVRGDYSPGFSVDNFVKDLRIALEEADAMNLSLPGLALVKQLYTSIQAMGKGSSGNQALYLALEKLSAMDKK
ncbi:NAD(P)-dependent oxidoreductase [Spirosoma sp. KCTC 42546]|uniref:NAD(P)-dependent oxidoreductase n=1 Tax=Spirosoma sp. KCTC 42546 TaxID=2520506 RepID=UPI00115C22BA|nr:NAD(P)-dependent oxidoreductase [Spirosoma sp. KCTC 42546]QDK79015.1 NAD(P)-dependent oxidoreductase [Spirosoma sp. KCTC 42546]